MRPKLPPKVGCSQFQADMAAAAASLRANQVVVIYLLHGTLAGMDTLGLMRELSRVLPGASEYLARQEKSLVDTLLGDTANYSVDYATQLEQALNAGGGQPISVQRYIWSGENHHFGRVEAAVRLVDELASLKLEPDQRVLLCGHSHAGNVLALLSNLMGGTPDSTEQLFRAVRPLARRANVQDGLESVSPVANWSRVHQLLRTQLPFSSSSIDMVTLGTPIRYGWETLGHGHLMHFVNHRPTDELPPYLVPFPLSAEQIVTSECGDFFQQFFIAGTNFLPTIFAGKMWTVEKRLGRLLQRGQSRRKLWDRLKCGQRVPADGACQLVDYAAADEASGRSIMGHGVYTRLEWMSFHITEIANRFYGTTAN
jgi:hypothetical protein